MANTNIVGDDGKVTFASGVALSVTSWSVDVTVDTAEKTAMGDGGWKSFLTSNKGWSGSCECILNVDDATGADTTSDVIVVGSTGALEFYPDKDSAGVYTGNAHITGYSVSSSIGDKITVSVSFQGTGALTY